MAQYFNLESQTSITADGTATLTIKPNLSASESRDPNDPFLDKHNIIINDGGFTAGTLTVTARPIGSSTYETVFENGSALVINLATSGEPFTRKLEGYCVDSIKLVGASMTGGSDWGVTVVSGY